MTVESYTVMHDRAGEPETGLFALLTATGGRTWGSTHDRPTMDELIATEGVGRSADLDADGHVHLG